ncbi:MAG TPA: G1 family glutamic endopeptidase [Acidimicrobiales bacterium]|nr:G1 family glutamic endopeptidase [Acidimicrobiales bacterium]
MSSCPFVRPINQPLRRFSVAAAALAGILALVAVASPGPVGAGATSAAASPSDRPAGLTPRTGAGWRTVRLVAVPKPGRSAAPSGGDGSREGARVRRPLDEVNPGGADVSDNWSGYVESGPGTTFTAVSGAWTVPSLAAGSPTGAASTWVGIGGWDTPGLVQTGTEVRNTSGYDEYLAWYEIVPQPPVELGRVAPGDQMAADIAQDGPATWTVTLTDVTEKTTWTGPVSAGIDGATAEWIEEAPQSASTGGILALADFKRVKFTSLAFAGSEAGSVTAQPFYLVSKKSILAWPSRYDATTNSFTVTYGSPPAGVTAYVPMPIGTVLTTATPTTTTVPTPNTSTPNTSTPNTSTTAPRASPGPLPSPPMGGYWLVGADGGVFAFGGAHFYGSGTHLGRRRGRVVAIAATPDHRGYWLVNSAGTVLNFGDATNYGSVPSLQAARKVPRPLPGAIVAITATADGHGYYLLGGDGSVYAFGDARYRGSCGSIFGGCATPAAALVLDGSGDGYWLLLQDGTTVAFGNAPPLRNPDCIDDVLVDESFVDAGAATPAGRGYWSLLAEGTTCATGDAADGHGIWAAFQIANIYPAVALVTTDGGEGAWVVLGNGEVQPLGTALSYGSLAGKGLNDIVGAAGW